MKDARNMGGGLPLIVTTGLTTMADLGYMTTHEAADRLGIKSRSVVQLIRRDILAATKYGRDYMIEVSEIDRYERERKPAHRPKGPRN